jgi:hypothetical protein
MEHILRLVTLAALTRDGSTTAKLVGDEHGSQSSFYVSRDRPGSGPDAPMLSVNVHASSHMEQTDLACRRRDDGSYELV